MLYRYMHEMITIIRIEILVQKDGTGSKVLTFPMADSTSNLRMTNMVH